MAPIPKRDYEVRRRAWAVAMQGAADLMGTGSLLTKAMGSVAWGRYEGEPQPDDSKDNVVRGAAYLQGVRDALLRVGRELRLPEAEALARVPSEVDRIARGWR